MRNRQTKNGSWEAPPPPPAPVCLDVPRHVAENWATLWKDAPAEVRNPAECYVLEQVMSAVKDAAPVDPLLLLRAINSTSKSVRDATIDLLHKSLAHSEHAANILAWFFANSKAKSRAFIVQGLHCNHPTLTQREVNRFMDRALRDRSAWVRECAVRRLEGERFPGCISTMRDVLSLTTDEGEQQLLTDAIEIIETGFVIRETGEPDSNCLEICYVRTIKNEYDSHVIFWPSRRRVKKYGARRLIQLAEERHRREIKR